MTLSWCSRFSVFFFSLAFAMIIGALTAFAADLSDLKVFPAEVNLSTKNDPQSLVVQAIYADGVTRDVTAEAELTVTDKALAKLDKHTLHPLADGKTTVQ